MFIRHLFSDVDLTLTTFDAEGAYRAAGEELEKKIGADPYRRLLRDYHGIHSGDPKVKDAIAKMFMKVTRSKNPPEEVSWCRAAAFLVVLEEHLCIDSGLGSGTILDALDIEVYFWNHITATSRPYDDALDIFARVRTAGARLHLVTSSDVRLDSRVTRSGISAEYDPEISSAAKRDRVERVLGRFHPLYVFEEHRKASREGWGMYVLPHCKDVDMATSAIIGDSLGDVEAGVTMEMPIRILIDRNGKYNTRPEPATHLVRSLNEVPAILGWT